MTGLETIMMLVYILGSIAIFLITIWSTIIADELMTYASGNIFQRYISC